MRVELVPLNKSIDMHLLSRESQLLKQLSQGRIIQAHRTLFRFIWSIPDTGFSDQADEWNSNRFSDYALAQGRSSYHLQRESNSNSLPDDGSLPSSNSYGQHLELNSNWSPEKMPMNTPISRAKG